VPESRTARTVDAEGCAVTPGFINMLSWGAEPMILDGRGLSDLKQGVTLEIFGEGSSLGPLNPEMRRERLRNQRPRQALSHPLGHQRRCARLDGPARSRAEHRLLHRRDHPAHP
jgi:hypothetical protein